GGGGAGCSGAGRRRIAGRPGVGWDIATRTRPTDSSASTTTPSRSASPPRTVRRGRSVTAPCAKMRAHREVGTPASGNARDIRQLAAAVWPERHCAIQRIRTAGFSELTGVSRRGACELYVDRLAWLDGHVGQRLVVATRGPAPERE